ncbi:MAG: ATP-binding cassette domain-containing protein [Actinomycetota bacterium]|jgi:branched-chain amino acid transport system ATP-binding protein|nr:ATP-binding cassette domain-containing protein [Actinomycetota bacterium]
MTLLSVRGLTKSFGGTVAVTHVDLDLSTGESVGLVGPNGAGKTTLFDCIFGQLRPDAGTIELDGRDIGGLSTWRRARLGIGRTYQRLEVFPDLTVREHLLVALEAGRTARWGRLWKDLLGLGEPSSEELATVDSVLEAVGLRDVADTPVAALGLGTCRIVELARAVVARPRVLLADEPSSGLDERETVELAQLLRSLQVERAMGILLVEHDLSMVEAVVDRVVVMDLGRVVASGGFHEVMRAPAVQRAYLGSP